MTEIIKHNIQNVIQRINRISCQRAKQNKCKKKKLIFPKKTLKSGKKMRDSKIQPHKLA